MIKPINGMLLVQEEEASEKTTAAGIILSATVTDLGPKKSKVVAVGSEEINHFTCGILPMDFEVGDTVVYPDHTGVDIKDEDGTEYVLIHSKHILAKIS